MDEETSRLASLDKFGHRKGIIPAEVKGFFRKYRTISQSVLIIIFLLLPLVKINGAQAILVDIVNKQFAFFGMQFWAHDAPLTFFIFAILTVGLAFITALWGRVWCGWGCPQTVFIDGVYRRIEIWIEGNYLARRQLRDSPMSLNKFIKYSLKWFAFFIVSSIISHSFVAYFVGTEKLITMMSGSPQQNWNYFLLVSFMTGVLLFNFGWFREQFCIIMCPYGRFQSVLMDSNSVTVMYDEKRGEPRKGSSQALQTGKRGDCVACNRCVQVCPTGIDIRNGIQLECIACTACIDACDDIMTKVHKPKGLIKYSSMREKTKFFRPRIIAYLGLIFIFSVTLAFNLSTRSAFMVTVLRGSDSPYQVMADDSILNHFKIHVHNQKSLVQNFKIKISEEDVKNGFKLTTQSEQFEVHPSSEREVHFFILSPKEKFNEKGISQVDFLISTDGETGTIVKTITLLGPIKN